MFVTSWFVVRMHHVSPQFPKISGKLACSNQEGEWPGSKVRPFSSHPLPLLSFSSISPHHLVTSPPPSPSPASFLSAPLLPLLSTHPSSPLPRLPKAHGTSVVQQFTEFAHGRRKGWSCKLNSSRSCQQFICPAWCSEREQSFNRCCY